MRKFRSTPIEMFTSLWRNRSLIYESTKREVQGRYRGSAMGLTWSVFNPVLMLAVYTFVFSEVFKARWSEGNESKTEFALVLFAGLIVFNLFTECINRAPSLILSNVNYVKKVVFPLEILPIVSLLSALYHTVISLFVWLAAYMILFGIPHITSLYLPLILIPYGFFIIGLSWALASLGVYLRDVGQIIGVFTMVLMFLSPVFYPASGFPESYRHLLYLNPLTLVIEQVRAVLYFGKAPNFMMLAIYWLVSIILAWMGFAWFQKTRKGFADVL
ncbi:ABC transporter permease [Candidatus Phycosocius spiralis]|uniref:Transport permease protein n=1 Tax=Candidatus Phycosocius spiralis TaxID=2815099 RepID=A0ABQ4PUE6_9PROT|nr:ABC transporter permease [Candidatus Phycosocius spiralis]GIU66637.1 transport permease protein [Candidatus Phycosocius spiralis]